MCTVVEILEEIKKNITLEGSFILGNQLQYTLNPPTKSNYTRRGNLGIKKNQRLYLYIKSITSRYSAFFFLVVRLYSFSFKYLYQLICILL